MATVQEILSQKGAKVHTISPGASVLEATEKMNQARIGSLVVMDNDQVVGIFTERDVLRRVVGEERRPSQILVGEVMTTDVVCCRPDMDIDEVGAVMREKRIRHVPVCSEEGQLNGLISIGDVNTHYTSSQQATIHYLNEYIYGRV